MSIEDVRQRIPVEWGRWISIGPGWHDIISDLNDKLADIDPNYTVHQVKEKFGGLRYYYSTETDRKQEMDQLVSEAVRLANETCGVCGGPATMQDVNGWYYVICDECAEKQALDNAASV